MKKSEIEKQKILVIDDDPVIRRIVRNTLEENGYAVLLAAGGIEGFKIANSASPDLVLLEIMLPDLDGFDVCLKLRSLEMTSEIAIIIMTVADQPSDVVRGFDNGADDYITKPFSIDELIARVKAQLRRRTLSRHNAQG